MCLITVWVVLFFWFVSFSSNASAKVTINEISPASDPEWIELYSDSSDSLQGCVLYLHESEETKQKIIVEEDIKIEKYLVIHKGEYNWSSNWLNNAGDTVRVKCDDLEDKYSYSDSKGKTIGRNPDGTGEFYMLTQGSEGEANALPTPSPTPRPSLTPSPTTQPTEPPVSSSPTTVPTAQPSDELVETPTNKKELEPKPKAVLAVNDEAENSAIILPQPSPTSSHVSLRTTEPVPDLKPPYFSYGLIGGGLVFVGVGAYPLVKKIYNEKYAPGKDKKIP